MPGPAIGLEIPFDGYLTADNQLGCRPVALLRTEWIATVEQSAEQWRH